MTRNVRIETVSDSGLSPIQRGHGGILEQVQHTTITFVELTRQGVRNLNGPKMDGRYNGRRHANCPHHKSPDYPTFRTDTVREVEVEEGYKKLKKVSVYYCSGCGEERWFE